MPAYGDTPGIKEREKKEFWSAGTLGNKRIPLGGKAERRAEE